MILHSCFNDHVRYCGWFIIATEQTTMKGAGLHRITVVWLAMQDILVVCSESQGMFDATPIDNALVVNIGDLCAGRTMNTYRQEPSGGVFARVIVTRFQLFVSRLRRPSVTCSKWATEQQRNRRHIKRWLIQSVFWCNRTLTRKRMKA